MLFRSLLSQHENQTLIKGSILEDDWLENFDLNTPVLFIAGGLFHYFSHDEVIKSFKILQNFKNAELVFDTLNKWGIRGIKRYMKELGHDEATMYFYVDNGEKLGRPVADSGSPAARRAEPAFPRARPPPPFGPDCAASGRPSR